MSQAMKNLESAKHRLEQYFHPVDRSRLTQKDMDTWQELITGESVECLTLDDGDESSYLVWAVGEHPVTKELQCVIIDLSATNVDSYRSLLNSMVEVARGYEDVPAIYIEVSEFREDSTLIKQALSELEFSVVAHHLRRVVEPVTVDPNSSVQLTMPKYQYFATQCLSKAAYDAISSKNISRSDVSSYIRERFTPLQAPNRVSAVAVLDGTAYGHGLFEIVPARIGLGQEAVLFDIFTVPEEKNKGWSQKIWTFLAHQMNSRNIDRVEGTYQPTPDNAHVLANLIKQGWWSDRVSFTRRIDQ